jgi:energy-coupling factor transport system permease protein
MLYRRRSTPLHAARPGAAMAWCAALVAATLIAANPAVLGVVSLTVLAGAICAQLGRETLRSLRWGLGLALSICVINALVSQDGTTIIWRFGTLPLLGYRYVTAQAVGTGALLGLRALTLILVGVVYSLAVDPDAVLALARRLGFRSALTATVATRMIPVLLRDSRRMADAQRTRSGEPPSRLALLQASTSGVLDRALDVAATLEVRGFGLPGGRASRPSGAWSRQDLAFLVSAGLVLVTAILARAQSPWLAIVLAPLALAPFLDRRGVG